MKRVVCVLLILAALGVSVSAAALSRGSRGDDVKELQTALRERGFDPGEADGVYGPRTREAVIAFQEANGLTPDGVAGPKTLSALGLQTQSAGTSSDVYLLARAVYAEARGEVYLGKVAVAAIVLNRVNDPGFPNSVSGVIYQPGAFDSVSDGQINLAPDEECIRAARDAFAGWDPTGGCLYYYNPRTATNKWMLSKPVLLTVGEHVFCR